MDFAGLTYLSLFLVLRLSVIRPISYVRSTLPDVPISSEARTSISLFRLLIVFIPLGAATVVSVTRVLDNRHHPFDVLFGSVLGIGCAWIGYRFALLPHWQAREEDGQLNDQEALRSSEYIENYMMSRVERV